MATLHNMQPVIGIKVLDDGATLYNDLPVIGVRDAAGETFSRNRVVRGVVPTEKKLFEDQIVRGVVVITDDRALYNNQPIMPVDGLPSG